MMTGKCFERCLLLMAGICLVLQNGCSSTSGLSRQTLISVPSGTFVMGMKYSEAANNSPEHEVVLRNGFKMGKFEVTNGQFAEMLNVAVSKGYIDMKILADGVEKKTVLCNSASPQKLLDLEDTDCQIEYEHGRFVPHNGREGSPVVEVSWYGAAFFCNMLSEAEGLEKLYDINDWSCTVYGKAGYRLPTEAEWEYAAGYPDGRMFAWGNDKPGESRANVNNVLGQTSAGGRYSPAGDSALGLCDITGNVAEWCNDWYDLYSGLSKEVDPAGPPQSPKVWIQLIKNAWPLRVVRGGAWQFDPSYAAKPVPFRIDTIIRKDSITTKARSFDYPTLTRPMLGFRVVKIGGDQQPVEKSMPLKFKSVKYVGGDDGQWFTHDDIVYHYFTYEFSDSAQVVMTKRMLVGPDGLPFTGDDNLEDYERREFGPDGLVLSKTSFDSPGADGSWFTADDNRRWEQSPEYDSEGRKVKVVRRAGGEIFRVITYKYDGVLNIMDCEYRGSGPDAKWGTDDDVLEKYHRSEYDASGRIFRMMEYHSDHGGRGADGIWFTGDDVISATMSFFYDSDGLLVKEVKAIGAGVDGEWFSGDDVLQYYSVPVYTMTDSAED